jgi:hypothetical protein
MTSFTDYFEQTWIGTSARSPFFSRSKWYHYEDIAADIERTPSGRKVVPETEENR